MSIVGILSIIEMFLTRLEIYYMIQEVMEWIRTLAFGRL